ncbi:plasmid stabilization system protein ParE [Sphingomonas jinjuensis]|uniref:Plasmid stabilization system protein ParE n=1 Tax=Sphingomonas jinjuensis TaxID=535907 RepID=A0A840FN64_9SPHN|nr:type II toxin-antitoxin system RelE/ParE family toxin [Sphingomonas jinjuensis]MBB4155358.1 plasmid stabilization system protein ParE [Sphingomonas jinjuensis]
MPHLILTEKAARGVARCLDFLAQHDEPASLRASAAIASRLVSLKTRPLIGRPAPNDTRELVIPFGSSGYVARYRYDATRDTVMILAVRHQREAGYR